MEGKNLFDIQKEINENINFINSNNEHIVSIEINQYTLNYLKSKNIYGFSDVYNKQIPIIINDDLNNYEIKFNREKNIRATEYEPYKVGE